MRPIRPRGDEADQPSARCASTYHCASHCVRETLLLSENNNHRFARKPWIESRLKALTAIFAIDLDTFNIMDDRLHLVLTIRPDIVAVWSDREVAQRWLTHLPSSSACDVPQTAKEEDIRDLLCDPAKIARCRLRLCSLSEFHKAFKTPLAQLANREENMTGRFWQSGYKSRQVLDRTDLLSTMAYVDLNPIRASMERTPEQRHFTGVHHRIMERAHALHRRSRRESATLPHEPAPSFLTPISGSPSRRGLFDNITLDEYLMVIDRIDHVIRLGKRSDRPHDLSPILTGIEVHPALFLKHLSSTAKWAGSVID